MYKADSGMLKLLFRFFTNIWFGFFLVLDISPFGVVYISKSGR